MTALYYFLIAVTATCSLMDMRNTLWLVHRFGLVAEANPIARWVWKRGGDRTIIITKLTVTGFYTGVMFFNEPTPLMFWAVTVTALVYAAVASRGQALLSCCRVNPWSTK